LDDQIAEGIAGRRFFRTIYGMFMIMCQKHCQEQVTVLKHGITASSDPYSAGIACGSLLMHWKRKSDWKSASEVTTKRRYTNVLLLLLLLLLLFIIIIKTLNVIQLLLGQVVVPKKTYRMTDERVSNIVRDYANSTFTEFLRAITHNFRF